MLRQLLLLPALWPFALLLHPCGALFLLFLELFAVPLLTGGATLLEFSSRPQFECVALFLSGVIEEGLFVLNEFDG